MHAHRSGMDDDVEVEAVELRAEQRLGAGGFGEGANAVGIAPGDGDLGAGIGEREGGSAGGSAVANRDVPARSE